MRLKTDSGSGTGFLFGFDVDGVHVQAIVTNRHVIDNNPFKQVTFEIHLDGDSINELIVEKITLEAEWILHPTEDLAICITNPLLSKIQDRFGRDAFVREIPENILATSSEIANLSALEEVTMIGYPIGLYDEAHALPIFRKGYTASHPAVDFNNEPRGLIDIAGIWGSSGSPSSFTTRAAIQIGTGILILAQTEFCFWEYNAQSPSIHSRGQLFLGK